MGDTLLLPYCSGPIWINTTFARRFFYISVIATFARRLILSYIWINATFAGRLELCLCHSGTIIHADTYASSSFTLVCNSPQYLPYVRRCSFCIRVGWLGIYSTYDSIRTTAVTLARWIDWCVIPYICMLPSSCT